jgi:hypothetical protein
MNESENDLRIWEDIGYACRMTLDSDVSVIADFKVVAIGGHEADSSAPLYPVPDQHRFEPTPNFAEAEILLSGSVKWDGCSNMNFDEQDRVMLHFCSKTDAANIGVLMTRLYEWAAEIIPGNTIDEV